MMAASTKINPAWVAIGLTVIGAAIALVGTWYVNGDRLDNHDTNFVNIEKVIKANHDECNQKIEAMYQANQKHLETMQEQNLEQRADSAVIKTDLKWIKEDLKNRKDM